MFFSLLILFGVLCVIFKLVFDPPKPSKHAQQQSYEQQQQRKERSPEELLVDHNFNFDHDDPFAELFEDVGNGLDTSPNEQQQEHLSECKRSITTQNGTNDNNDKGKDDYKDEAFDSGEEKTNKRKVLLDRLVSVIDNIRVTEQRHRLLQRKTPNFDIDDDNDSGRHDVWENGRFKQLCEYTKQGYLVPKRK